MRIWRTLAIAFTALAGSFTVTAPARAAVTARVSLPGYYGMYRFHGGPCASPDYAFGHPARCGYPRYNEPVLVDGMWVNEPLHYRLYRGNRYFWHRDRWVIGHGKWDGHVYRGAWKQLWRERGWDALSAERREHSPDRSRERDEDDVGRDDHDADVPADNDRAPKK